MPKRSLQKTSRVTQTKNGLRVKIIGFAKQKRSKISKTQHGTT